MTGPVSRLAQLPFFYGWVVIGVAFVTMAIGVSARTGFSLMLPPLTAEFGWDRGLVAGAFSFGFLVSAILSPIVGRAMDRYGPRLVIECGVLLLAAGLFLAPMMTVPWHLYATLGVLVGGGANMMTFTAQSLYLPNWFARRRGLAISIAFSGVGVGAIIILPLLQSIIIDLGWREACWAMGLMVVCLIAPLNLLVRHKPADIGQVPDGIPLPVPKAGETTSDNIVDREWAAQEWTLGRALRTARFWWLAFGFFMATYTWYAVQVHQTTFLIESGFDPIMAGWALGLVSIVAIPGQIGLGALSDRIGREAVWSLGCLGFLISFATLIALAWRGEPVIGIIDQPIQRERWVGVTGKPTLFNGKPVQTRECAGLDHATFFSWGAECFEGDRGAALWRLAEGTALRRYSADAYAYGLLALGFVDIVAENDLKPHDYLALAPVVNGAGGRITDWEGNPIRFGTGAETVAVGDPALHAQVIARLKG